MLPELIDFEDEVTLVMNSGVQFLDFGINIDPKKEDPGEFGEQPGTRSLARLEYDARRDRYIYPGQPEIGVRPIVPGGVPVDDSLKLLEGVWLPIPLLREGGGERFEKGPSNWARARLMALAEGDDPEGNTHRITIACDTRVHEFKALALYLAPTTEDVKTGIPFRLAHRAHWMGWFLEEPWVGKWIEEVFCERAAVRLHMDGEDIKKETNERLHQAHYLNWLHVLGKIGKSGKPPCIRILSNTPDDRYDPIPVDLVLDVGNSRTCGILIETHPQEHDGLSKRYELELRDLSQPCHVYTGPFESRIEFAQVLFGKENFSHESGRHDVFVWPTMVRVGREATHLASRRRGTEGSTGISSPKRYLWDTEPYQRGWRLNVMSRHAEAGEPLATVAPFATLINDMGQPLYELEAVERMPVFTPRYTRSSLMMFMLSEVLAQALMQINSPAQRLKQSHSETPRFLRSITLTVPPSMPKPERQLFLARVRQARNLVWKAMEWYPPEAEIPARDAELAEYPIQAFPPLPTIHVEWDEASCGQVVYLFSEVQNKFGGRTDEFFALMRRANGKTSGDDKKLTIGTIDIGGGTTDLVITDYELDEGQGVNVFITPKQRFRDGFKLAGDDIILQVIQELIVPALGQALEAHGLPQSEALLSRLIGHEAVHVQDATLRQQLVLQVLYPLGLRLLQDYERYDPLDPVVGLGMQTIGELLGKDQPSEEVCRYVAGAVRGILGAKSPDFDLLAVPLKTNPRSLHDLFMKGRMDIYRTIQALCEVVFLYQCDVLLLTGRPSLLPGIQALFRALLPLPPGRIVPMHDYHAGVWYPFHRQGRIGDPKTTAAVGAMLCILGRGRLPNFFFRADRLIPYSTVRFIGQMDDNNTIKKENEFFQNVDLDNPEYQLPETPFEMRGMMRLGFRQLPVERWPAAPLYTLSFVDDKLRKRLYSEGEAARITLEQDRRAKGEERFKVRSDAIRSDAIKLQLNTLANVGLGVTSYWLDSGSVYGS